jgi:hypothetical protein
MLSGTATSSVNVSIPFSVRLVNDVRERAVAKTLKPLLANSRARALPAPP